MKTILSNWNFFFYFNLIYENYMVSYKWINIFDNLQNIQFYSNCTAVFLKIFCKILENIFWYIIKTFWVITKCQTFLIFYFSQIFILKKYTNIQLYFFFVIFLQLVTMIVKKNYSKQFNKNLNNISLRLIKPFIDL